MPNIVYIAASLDGFIADRDGGLDWLHRIPNPDNDDYGWSGFLESIHAIVMGRNTFDVVRGFGGAWPYPCPVYVWSSSLQSLPEEYDGKATLVGGSVADVLTRVHADGHSTLYIDGGLTVQSFLREDAIDKLIVTRIPVLLGGGAPLFGDLRKEQWFEHIETKVFGDALVQSHYRRVRGDDAVG